MNTILSLLTALCFSFGGFFLLSSQVSKETKKNSSVYTYSNQVQPEFYESLNDFLIEAEKNKVPKEFQSRLSNLTIKFGDPRIVSPHFIGYCDMFTRTVIVLKEAWDIADKDSKQVLIDHELGHCLLERNHRHIVTNNEDKTYSPHSIMFPNVLPGFYYIRNKTALRRELFEESRHNNYFVTIQMYKEKQADYAGLFKNDATYSQYIENLVNRDLSDEKVAQLQLEPLEITAKPKK